MKSYLCKTRLTLLLLVFSVATWNMSLADDCDGPLHGPGSSHDPIVYRPVHGPGSSHNPIVKTPVHGSGSSHDPIVCPPSGCSGGRRG